MRFLDTNVIIRYLTRDDEEKAEACYQLFQRVNKGEERLATTETIIAEVAYVLSSNRAPYRLKHYEIRARLLPIITMRGLRLPHKQICINALNIYASSDSLDFEDALSVAHMQHQAITEIVSYDKDFDAFPDILRVEPSLHRD